MLYLKDAFNSMRTDSFGLHAVSCQCSCDVCCFSILSPKCIAREHRFDGITHLWESCLCAKMQDSTYHQYKCLMGECSSCGVKRLMVCPRECNDDTKTVSVQVFEDIEDGVNRSGEKKRRKVLSMKQVALSQFMVMLQEHTLKFIKHNFVYRWQAEQFKNCLSVFPDDTIVSVVDFAENYTFKEQNEIQSMHWHNDQCTILVHISYRRSGTDSHVIKDMHFYISDDRKHDTHFVQHCFLLHHQWLKDQGLVFNKHWVWSDGAASQFKAARPFYFVARYFKLTAVQMSWNFSASGHGKGEHDGAGAVVKRALTNEQLKSDGATLKNAGDVVRFLQETMPESNNHGPRGKCHTRRMFWEIKLGDVDRSKPWACA